MKDKLSAKPYTIEDPDFSGQDFRCNPEEPLSEFGRTVGLKVSYVLYKGTNLVESVAKMAGCQHYSPVTGGCQITSEYCPIAGVTTIEAVRKKIVELKKMPRVEW